MTTTLTTEQKIKETVKNSNFPEASNVVSIMDFEGREVILISFENNRKN